MASIVLRPTAATARTLGVPVRELQVHDGAAALGSALLRASSDAPDMVIVHELELAYGRPDVVAAAVDLRVWRAWRRRNIAACTAPLLLTTALALQGLGGTATLDTLAALSTIGENRPRLRRSLAALADRRWVRRTGDTFALRVVPGEALHSVSGVEAKLNNWRRAVRQVQSWQGYVDAAWLAFPVSYLPRVPRTPALRPFGLIAVEDGVGRVVRRPTGPVARGVRRVLIEQHVYARWLETAGRGRLPAAAPESATS